MAAPVADKIILPLDTGNTGKNVRTQTRVVGANTVHEHYFIPTSARSVLGRFKASSGVLVVPAAVQTGAATGMAWLINPVGSAVKIAVKRIDWNVQFIALAVDLLGGELRFSLCTFTGVASAGLVTPAKNDSALAAAVGNLRTASTGLTVTVGATVKGEQYPTMDLVTGGAGHWNPFNDEWVPDSEDDEIVLRAGEGLAIWHAVAVTAGNRRLYINVAWDEFE
jgi:hypothetical protein